jgi:bacterioferritin
MRALRPHHPLDPAQGAGRGRAGARLLDRLRGILQFGIIPNYKGARGRRSLRRAVVRPDASRGEWRMKGDAKVIEYLNRGLRSELTAVNQYWLHFRLLNDWGYVDLAKFWRKESIEEMNHADRFIDRILFLDGFPNLQELDPLRIGQNVQEIIECDLAAENEARALYLEAAKYCDSINDRVSKRLFEDLAEDEEGHIDFLETQLDLIGQIGLPLYAQRHVGGLEQIAPETE